MANESTVASRYPALDVARYRSASPSLVDTLLEGARTMSEAATLTVIWRWLRHHSRVQDHREQPVMVLPGFLGGDASTIVLRRFLGDLGFTVHPWLLGTNDGTERLQNELLRRFLRLSQTYKRPIALVGHSLGGVFARELARQFPQQVSQVITLGSPFAIADPNSVNRLVSLLFERISGESVEDKRISMLHAEPHHPTGVPSTAIYSRTDGVVHWRSCLEQHTAITQNIEVWGSHCGLVVNPSVLFAVADRLDQRAGQWRRFDYTKGPSKLMFPVDKAIYA